MNPLTPPPTIADGTIPGHVAVIMDGNGRWASERGLPRHEGHREGMKAVREVIEGAVDAGVRVLTLFAFSTENWQRPEAEIFALMALLRIYAEAEQADLKARGVEVRVLGELERVDAETRQAIDEIQSATAGGDRLRLNLMVSYSGRSDIVSAARRVAEHVAAGVLQPDAITPEIFAAELCTEGLPDPDLLIRTSGEFRISNFLLWELAYTEVFISPVLWPDFTRDELFRAVREYQSRERRFGRVTPT